MTFPSGLVRVLRTHHLPTERVRCLSVRAEVGDSQLLAFRGADDNISRDGQIHPGGSIHPMTQPLRMQLPEADGLPTVPDSICRPSRLVPGVRQGTHDKFPIPACPDHLHLDMAGIVVGEGGGTDVDGQL